MLTKNVKLILSVVLFLVLAVVVIYPKIKRDQEQAHKLDSELTLEGVTESTFMLGGKIYALENGIGSARGIAGDNGAGCKYAVRRDSVVFGDINADAAGDAAGIISVDCNSGAHSVYLALWQGTEGTVGIGTPNTGITVLLGERVPIFSISFVSPYISVNHGLQFGGQGTSYGRRRIAEYLFDEGTLTEDTARTRVVQLHPDDWNTYTSTKYGISFSYPDDWGKVREFTEKGVCPAREIA